MTRVYDCTALRRLRRPGSSGEPNPAFRTGGTRHRRAAYIFLLYRRAYKEHGRRSAPNLRRSVSVGTAKTGKRHPPIPLTYNSRPRSRPFVVSVPFGRALFTLIPNDAFRGYGPCTRHVRAWKIIVTKTETTTNEQLARFVWPSGRNGTSSCEKYSKTRTRLYSGGVKNFVRPRPFVIYRT